MENDHVQGGAFQIARKLFESDLWENRPSSWKVIWIYILGNVNHKETKDFKRGEGFFNFSKDLRKIGNDITEDMVKKFCVYARSQAMISTERSTRGMRIRVLNYDTYQTMGNYIRTSLGTSQARAKHEPSTPINKNEKNVKNENLPAYAGIPKVIPDSEESERVPNERRVADKLAIYHIFSKTEQPWWIFAHERKSALALFDLKGVEQVQRGKDFMDEHADDEFCPQASSPSEYSKKLPSLMRYKKKKDL